MQASMIGCYTTDGVLIAAAGVGMGFFVGFFCASMRTQRRLQFLRRINRVLGADIAATQSALEEEIKWRLAANREVPPKSFKKTPAQIIPLNRSGQNSKASNA
jgi:hypothetical protein